jgi:methylated-DNA-protein-cysteine methyltransferase-like protein
MKGARPGGSYEAIYRVVAAIPPGTVATYGQVAVLAGLPGHARQVGYALHSLPDDLDLPWQRVINAKGEVSLRSPDSAPGREGYQRHLLEEEGIEFDLSGRVDLKRFGWDPDALSKGSKGPGGRSGRKRPTSTSRRSAIAERRRG